MSSLQTNSHCRSGYWNRGLFCHTSESALPPPSSPAWTPLTHQCSTDPHIWTPQLPLVSQRDHEGNKEEELRLRERSHAVPEVQRCAETTHKPELMSKASARVCKPKLCWDKKRTCLRNASVHMKINNSVLIYLPSFHCKPLWLSVFYELTHKLTTFEPIEFNHISKKSFKLFKKLFLGELSLLDQT